MAPTRRSTRAKSTDQGVAGSSPSTRTARARPVTKTNPPAVKPRAGPTRKTASKVQTLLEVEEKEEEEEVQEEAQEEQKPRAKVTRKGTAKIQTVSMAGKEEKKEIVDQKEIEDIVAAATRGSNRAASVASLQSPTKSKAARGRVAKKVVPARKIRGAVVEDEEVVDPKTEDAAASIELDRGLEPIIETANALAPTEIIEAVTRGRTGRGDVKKSKNPIWEPAVSGSSIDPTTPSWAKKRGGRKAKVLEDEIVDDSVSQHTEAETEVAKVDVEDTKIKDAEPEPVAAKGRGRKKGTKVAQGGTVIEESETTVEVAEPEPAPKGRGSRRGKKADAIADQPETIVGDAALATEPEPVSRGKGKRGKKAEDIIEDVAINVAEPESVPKGRRGKKADAVTDQPETIVEDTVPEEPETIAEGTTAPEEPATTVEGTAINVAEPESVPKGRRGKKADAVADQPETIVEDTVVAKAKPVLKGRGSKKGKKADAVLEEPETIVEDSVADKPEAIVEDTVVVAKAEPILKGRGSKRGKKVDVIPEEPGAVVGDAAVFDRPEAVVEDTVIVSKAEPLLKGRGSKRGKKADAVPEGSETIVESTSIKVAEPEPVPKGRKGKKADVIIDQPGTTVEDTVFVAKADPILKGREGKKDKKVDAVLEEPSAVIEDAAVDIAEPEPILTGRGSRRGKKVDAVPQNTEVNPEPAVVKGKKGKKAEDTKAVAEESGSVVEEPQLVPVKGGGRMKGRKVGTVVEEPEAIAEENKIKVTGPEPILAGGRARKRGKQAIRDVEIPLTNVDLQAAAGAENEVEGADAVVGGDVGATFQEIQVVGVAEIEVAEGPVVKSKGRKGKKAAPAKKGTRKGQKVMVELSDVEMSDTDVQTQETEVNIEAEPITTTGPTVKDSGVFFEDEPIIEGHSIDKLEPITEGPDTTIEESVVVAGTEIGVVAQGSNVVAGGEEPVQTVQSIEIEIDVIMGQPVAVESNAEQTRVITEGTTEPLKLFAKSPGSSKKKTPKGKGKAKIVVSIEQDVDIGEAAVEGGGPEPNIELEFAAGKSSTDIEMPGSDIGIEPEAARGPKSRKRLKRSATMIRKERQVRAAAKKVKGFGTGNAVGVQALDTVSDIFYDGVLPENIEKKGAEETEDEEVVAGGRELVGEAVYEEDEPDLPLPFSSPITKPTLILSPRRATPDPDLDPIKTPVPSSPLDRLMSHPLNSSPLRQNNPDSVVLASPRLVTTPRNSPSKKRSTPNTRTPINRLSGSGIPFGRNLEDSRDVRSISTPARGRNSSVASSPIMMPPATPNVVAGDARSPIKKTPTKESGYVRDMLDRVDEPSMLVGSITNINSSPVKNSTPIRAASGFEKSSPVGRLSFGGSDISQSSPLVGRLQINDPSLLLSSPLAVSPKTSSPTKAQHSSPTRSSPLKHSPLAMGSSGFFADEIVGESSFMSFDGDYNRIGEPDDDEEGEEDYQDQETFEYVEGEDLEEKSDQQPRILSTTEDENEDDSVDFDATFDESRLFKLAEKAMLKGDAEAEPEAEEQEEGERKVNEERKEKETEATIEMLGHNILTSRVSDFEVSCLEQVHPEFGQAETYVENAQEADSGGKEEAGGEGVAEGDLTFSDVVEGEDSIPSSPVLEITSPMKFDYRPTSEIFPSGEFTEAGDVSQEGPFSPIDMDFFGDRSFDTSAADWRESEEEEEEEEDEEEEETEPDLNSPGGRLRHFRASSPPNIWSADEEPGDESVGSGASPVPMTSMPWDESDFDFSEEFIRPPSESPEPGDKLNLNFSENPSLPTPREPTGNKEKSSIESQISSPAVGRIPPVGFRAGGAGVRPVVGHREPRAIADAWLGKKGLRPKEEKLSMTGKSVNDESKEGEEGDDTTEMKGGKRVRAARGVERIKKARKDAPELSQASSFLLDHGDGAKVEATVEKGRRQTFGGKPMARPTSPSKRRKSFPEGPTIPDRQSYLYASDPERILRHWAQHEKDQATPQLIAPISPLLSVAANPMVAGPSGGAPPKPSVRPSPVSVRPRRIRSVSSAVASSLSGHSSPLSIGGGKRKAVESLETERASKSSIPVSRRLVRPVNNKTQEEVDLVLKNTAHNALYSCKLDYEPVRKSGRRPPSLDNNGVQRLAAEARRKRKESEELGLMLRPGENEAFVAAEVQDGKKRIQWDSQLEYDCVGDLFEGPHARPESLPNKGILTVKPRLNLHGNWVPIPGVPPLKIPEELVLVKKIMYQGEGEETGKKGRK